MPTKKQMQVVIDNLKTVLPFAIYPRSLDMISTTVHPDCGTSHCFGGWYALATCKHITPTTDFTVGVSRMASDLGFQNPQHLPLWAKWNPAIWGNPMGISMFSSNFAFQSDKRPFGAETLQHIVDHLEEVRDRLSFLQA